MILVKLLGSIKKSCGASLVPIEKQELPLTNLFPILKKIAKNPEEITEDNLMILINNVEASALQEHNKILKSGDIVTVVSIIHGG
ncbi:MAG: MoaD/ThiS family protein [Nitrososphaeraceae archaeon]